MQSSESLLKQRDSETSENKILLITPNSKMRKRNPLQKNSVVNVSEIYVEDLSIKTSACKSTSSFVNKVLKISFCLYCSSW